MARKRQQRTDNLRVLVAQEAARLIVGQGVRDYYQAKAKAAARLGLSSEAGLPKNTEVEAAVREYQALFDGPEHLRRLERLRRAALSAMRFFAPFSPRLVGAVLEGTADAYSAVCLHLFSDTPEAVTLFLDDNGIPYDEETRAIRLGPRRTGSFPALLFEAGETPMDITVLPSKAIRQAPLSPVDGRPMRRASAHEVASLLAGAG